MYNERKDSFSIRNIAVQLLVVILFVFLLLWLFPTKSYVQKVANYEGGNSSSVDISSNSIFNENVKSMKEAAISYFTTSRLPGSVGDKVKLTLSEMLNEKLLLPFTDSKGKSCNLTESYIELTKAEDEYILKVNLSCEDNTDYILVHLGCYDYCKGNVCEKKETTTKTNTETKPSVKPVTNKVYEYEYVKKDAKWVWNKDWSEWTTTPIKASDTVKVETKDEYVPGSSYVQTASLNYYPVLESCPSGYKEGYDSSTGTYYCSKNVTTDSKSTVTYDYDCANGYTLSQDKKYCVKTYAASKTTQTAKLITNSSSKVDYVTTTSPKSGTNYTLLSTETKPDCESNGCKSVTYYYYKVTTTTKSTSCPSGYTKNSAGTSCYKTAYTCTGKDTLSGSTCTSKVKVTEYAIENFSCPSGYTLNSQNACSKTDVINRKYTYTYSCPSGYTYNGYTCTTTSYYAGYNVKYYRSLTGKYENTSDVVWSKSSKDAELIKKGYIYTGNLREVQ